ncbi:hypothetical protein KP509_05G099100 [Ceratopteris richardii]|uniref:Pentatricopeptide repeat-containing protein n=1 Tax=Ceratopteris richardii TaxID=49495 RepID=A0A8T2UVR3_CERRI|nr:hypothetical protein KP509_05G099100 [Ceratopteris richardii]
MYSKCGALEKARMIFNELPTQNVVSWTTLIAGYCCHGEGEKALDLFKQMNHEGLPLDAVVWGCILKVYGSIAVVNEGKEIHAEIARKGFLNENVTIGSALVDMYAKIGELVAAQEVFDELLVHNIVAWTALIAGYALDGQGERAHHCFKEIKCEGLFPNSVTLLCLLKACSNFGAADKGRMVHAEAIRQGYTGEDYVFGNALVDMYVKCGSLLNSYHVFFELHTRTVVAWTSLIAGYAKHGHYTKVLTCFNQMQRAGVLPDATTFTCLLKACGNLRAVEKGSEVHIEIVKHGHLNTNPVPGNALIDMYSKCGALEKARMIFNELPTQNVVSWTTLIAGYCCHGEGEKALDLFKQMNHEGLPLDAVVWGCILKVYGSIAAVNKGKEIHAEIARKGFLNENVTIGSALVDMYAKIGELVAAQEVFDELPVHNIVPWTALIAGYALDGQGERAHHCFKEIKCEGLFPNSVTLLCLLKACSNFGAPDKGRMVHAEAIR